MTTSNSRTEHPVLEQLTKTVFPPILLTTAATFGWAIRGQAGFGAVPGCVFAGTLIATAWYFLSTRAGPDKARPYSSGWTMFAIILGIGIEGMHGWSQWGNWVQGHFNYASLPIEPAMGYIWWFVAAVPWGGTGAVFLAWTRDGAKMTPRLWMLRVLFGSIGFLVALVLFFALPSWFLPYYGSVPYGDASACHDCVDTYIHNLTAMLFMGVYLGFLAFEIWRKDWQNVKLILIVGIITGIGWMVFQFWMIADQLFGHLSGWNYWRCWESSAGFSIGLGYSVAFMMCNKEMPANPAGQEKKHTIPERYLGLYAAIFIGLTYAITSGVEGIFAIYDSEGNSLAYQAIAATLLLTSLLLALLVAWFNDGMPRRPVLASRDRAVFTMLYPVVLSTMFIIGFLVTGPITAISELYFI
nr:hypothetical protein [Candidatus Sigynarchaeota archaeon]